MAADKNKVGEKLVSALLSSSKIIETTELLGLTEHATRLAIMKFTRGSQSQMALEAVLAKIEDVNCD